jgi:HD-GYP domain-containing protein (c-di-GMP phosphodiesterase class II)
MPITIQTLISIFATATYGGVLLVVLLSKPLKKLHRIFLWYLTAMLIWSVASLVIFTESGSPLVWFRILVGSGIVAIAGMFYFVQNLFAKRRWWTPLVFWYSLCAVFFSLATEWAVQSAYLESGHFVYVFHPLMGLIVGPGYGLTIFSMVELTRGYRRSSSVIQRIRLRYLITAVALIILVSLINFTELGKYPIDIAVNGIAAILIAYAILRHSLLDLRIVIRTGLIYSIITGITGAIYYLTISLVLVIFENFVGGQILAISIVVALFSSVILSPLREKIQNWIDRFFFRVKYDANLMIQRLSETTAAIMDVEQISITILQEIIDTMKVETASFHVKYEPTGVYQLVSHQGSKNIQHDFQADHPIAEWLSGENRILTKDQLNIDPVFRSLWDRDKKWIEDQKIEFFISLVAREELLGFFAIGAKRSGQPFTREDQRILVTVANQTAIAVKNARLFNELQETFIQTVVTLANAIDIRDTYTSDHSQRIASLGVETAKIMNCDSDDVQRIYWGSLLHDVGKIGIPDRILLKPGPLDDDEWEVIKQHPDIGANLIQPIKQLAHISPIIRHSHEWYDGKGYPDGLKGDEIPFGARIVAVVDAFSAMMDKRVYKDANTLEETIEELKKFSGSQFDPQVVIAFLQVLESMDELDFIEPPQQTLIQEI